MTKAFNISATFNDVTNNNVDVNYHGVISAIVITYNEESVTVLIDNVSIDTTRNGKVLIMVVGK